jgi:DNA helicase-2/ATP-dependent DNA helicase PcrA
VNQLEELLSHLNESQQHAVAYNEGPSLVIAGAGSGKTRVLTYKIAYLLLSGYHPSSILALTFTNKAAREMKERIALLVGREKARWLWMGTFHSIFSRMLRAEAEKLGFTSGFTIYDSADSKSLLKTIIKELQLDDKLYKPGVIHGRISFAKNNLLTAGMYQNNADLYKADSSARIPRTGEIYALYATRCRQANAMDFDDLLLYTNILFRDFPEVLENYRQRFSFILVDEYQDTNFAQHLIVKRLAEVHQRISVVGDDAQSIYSFRGANIDNILKFKNHFPDSRLFKLEQNYRSTQNIVSAANSLIQKNKGQIQKNVFSENDKGQHLQVISAMTDTEEGFIIANKVSEIHLAKHHPFSDFAILYRTNAQSRIFEEALRKRNIPYKIYGGLSFYQRKEIKDILAYFRLIINRYDEEALKRIINYPSRGIGDTTIGKIADCAHTQQVSMWEVLSDPLHFNLPVNAGTAAKLSKFRDLILSFTEMAPRTDAYDLAQTVVKGAGIMADVSVDTSPENLSKQENIHELVSGIHEFCEQRANDGETEIGLTEFMSEVSLLTDQDTDSDDDAEKLTMMTIHSAKGLEFRNVFIVGMEEGLFPSGYVETESEVEEERRLFYVAITRAEEQCFVSYAKSRFRNGQLNFQNPSRFLGDIDQQYLDLPADYKMMYGRRFERSDEQERELFGSPLASKSPAQPHSEAKEPRSWKKVGSSPAGASTQVAAAGGISVGNTVHHDKFGEGKVVKIEQIDGNDKAIVDFGAQGIRALLLKYAKLEVIK